MTDYEFLHAQNWIEQFRYNFDNRSRAYRDRGDMQHMVSEGYVSCFRWAGTSQRHNVWARRLLARHPDWSGLGYGTFAGGEPDD